MQVHALKALARTDRPRLVVTFARNAGEIEEAQKLRYAVFAGEMGASTAMPPLIKGYLNIAARVCGEPAWDPDFNTADLPVILSIYDMTQQYKNHLVKVVIN